MAQYADSNFKERAFVIANSPRARGGDQAPVPDYHG
jgi:hypothetical protein